MKWQNDIQLQPSRRTDHGECITRRTALGAVILFAACSALAGVAEGQESAELTAYSFAEVQSAAVQLGEAHGPGKVLLVFDIDNTLLAMQRDLGSDQWYAWQRSLPEHHPWRVGDGRELLRVQGLLYAVSSMRATQPVHQPNIVRQLQEAGFTTLLLTSRGFEFRDATRRELVANGYDFRESTLVVPPEETRAGFPGPYAPYEVSQIGQSGITQQEAERWLAVDGSNPVQIKSPRQVSYNEGVYMTAGQNKGVMLRMLLHRSGNVGKFRAIVFVDDQPRHTEHVRQAFDGQGVELVTLRYTREDANVERFNANRCGEQYCAAVAWCRVEQSLRANRSRQNPPASSPEVVTASR